MKLYLQKYYFLSFQKFLFKKDSKYLVVSSMNASSLNSIALNLAF